VHKLNLFENADINCLVSSVDPTHYSNKKVRSLSISYGRGEAELKKISQEIKLEDVVQFQLSIKLQSIEVSLYCGIGKGKVDREYVKDKMLEEEYRNQFFKLSTGLGAGYWIEVMGRSEKSKPFNRQRCWRSLQSLMIGGITLLMLVKNIHRAIRPLVRTTLAKR
jgi:hypothetical protein